MAGATREARIDKLEAEVTTMREEHRAEFSALRKEFADLALLIQSLLTARDGPSTTTNPTPPLDPNPSDCTAAVAPIGIPPGRVELPLFNGPDPRAWLARAEQFFAIYQVPPSERVGQAFVVMTGDALYWIQWMLRRSPEFSWAKLSKELVICFGDDSTSNHYEAWAATTQTGSLEDYISRFIANAAQVPNLAEEHYLGQFLTGLRPNIRVKIREDIIQDVHEAVKWARQIDRELSFEETGVFQQSSINPTGQRPPAAPPKPGSNPAAPSPPHPPVGNDTTKQQRHQVRFLSPGEMHEHRRLGKCFRCSHPFGPRHVCPTPELQVLLMGEESADDLADEELPSQD